MHILIAPNAFKNSLDATHAAIAIQEGLQLSNLACTTQCFPVGDGGDGTGELILHHCKGTIIPVEVHDPLGRKILSSFGLIDNGKTAVIEMSAASGLRLLKRSELNPLYASSYGTGELINCALNKEVNKIILCIGGSATVDGAVGLLQALGFLFLNKNGKPLNNIPESLAKLGSIRFPETNPIMNCELVVLCDVENVLLGKQGAVSVFGPQKGATPGDVKKLEAALSRLRNVVLKQTGKDMASMKHGGASGGMAAGVAALLNAQLVNGIDHFLSLTHFDMALEKAGFVITGEGSIDIQTLQGKGPYGVAKKAKEKGIAVIGLAGKVPAETEPQLQKYFDMLVSINPKPVMLKQALRKTSANLKQTARALGNLIAMST